MDNCNPDGKSTNVGLVNSPENQYNQRNTSGREPTAVTVVAASAQKVKEAVAIAAGKKGMGHSEEDDCGKPVKSNMLCYLYWLLVLLILGLISFTVWLSIQLARRHSVAMMTQNGKYGEKEPFTFDDIFNSSFQPKSYNVKWILTSDSKDAYTFRSRDGSLMIHYVDTNITQLLIDKSIFEQLQADSYYVSPNLRYVLFKFGVRSKWRHSFTAHYAIYDRRGNAGTARLLKFPFDIQLSHKPLQYAVWSPSTSALLFAFSNNIYYQRDPHSEPIQLTFSGNDQYIFNGVADWLYEEEILSSHVAHWWSRDSRYVCYATFNDTKVPLFRFPYYGQRSEMYGDIVEFAYPKAGDTTPDSNTRVTLHVVDMDNLNNQHIYISPPPEFHNQEHYVTQVSWAEDTQLATVWSNRAQNKTITTICHIPSNSCFNNFYQTVSGGWFDPLPTIVFLNSSKAYATILPKTEADSGTWNHLAVITTRPNEDGQVLFLTHGQHEVKSIVAFKHTQNILYYLSTAGDPKKRHLFSVKLDATNDGSHCLSCNVSTDCQYVTASFSLTAQYYILGCLGPGIPTYALKDANSSLNVLLEDNLELRQALTRKALPIREFIEIPIGGGSSGWAEILTPPSVDNDDKGRRYPLLVHTYGSPGSQKVTERFRIGFETYLTSSEEIVYASLDGRGTSSRGNRFKHSVYRKLGSFDVEDQLLGGLFLKKLEYVDPAKAAIWGWSYGGFITSHAVANETDIFPCGISGAALSDRRYYDTAHTERYMGMATVTDNYDGYERTDVMRKVEYFRNKKFLMVHGTADDNVHFASSAHLVKALVDADIQFRFQLYADSNHYYISSSRHFYHLMTDFLKNDCYSYFWKHDTQSWIVDKSVKKEKFRIKQFCV